MSFIQSLYTFGIFIFLVTLSEATYNAAAKSNVIVYYGQGPSQLSLSHFCQQSTIDIIVLGFVNVFPAQGNGYPGTNFGNQCWGGTYVYKGPGNNHSKDQLQSSCPQMVADIPVCQNSYGKKIILSLGGGTNTYQLTGAADGVAFADFLWGAFGPRTSAWVASGKPRPFDGANGQVVQVDGFDFDIELPSTDNAAGYIAMINRLRSNFAASSKQYLITGAPQCVVPDANMGAMITKAKFDIIWVQFYNTAQCSASNWAKANPNYATTKKELASGFNYNAWTSYLAGGASKDAKLYIGISGSTKATPDPSYYLSPAQISNLAQAYFCKPNFGGIMIWEATFADNNINSGSTYYQTAKNLLSAYGSSLKCSSSTTSISKRAIITSSTTVKTNTRTTSATTTMTITRPKSSTTKSSATISSTTKRSSTSTTSKTTSTSTKGIVSSSPLKTTPTSNSIKTTSKSTSTSRKSSSITTYTSKSTSTSKPNTSSMRTTSKTSTSKTSTKTSVKSTSVPSTKQTISSLKPSSTSSTTLQRISSTKSTSTSISKSPTTASLKSTSKSSTISTTQRAATTTAQSSLSSSKTASSSKTTTATYPPAPAGACGAAYGVPCPAGNCCSQYGYCGTGTTYCGNGCQKEFGICS